MASPQRENGHIDIAHEISYALMRLRINGVQSRLLWVIWRKTYGWHKSEDAISLSQFKKFTMLSPKLISRELLRLENRNIIVARGDLGKTKIYSFQKDYEKWNNYLPISRQLIQELSTNQGIGLSTKRTTTIYQSVDELSTNQGNTKEIKETIQKKETSPYLTNPLFQNTWDAWLEVRTKLKVPNTARALQLALIKLNEYPIEIAIKMLEQSIERGWRGVFPFKKEESTFTKP